MMYRDDAVEELWWISAGHYPQWAGCGLEWAEDYLVRLLDWAIAQHLRAREDLEHEMYPGISIVWYSCDAKDPFAFSKKVIAQCEAGQARARFKKARA